ncbi:MBL fold metallo-hydrolase [Paenibacillus puldeungensis]|uniref:MBL fold metallo-hydrolase n=1 Tax=Paenibacillus puldeungensis TaxID=696536 RepID=A0ABW3RYL3_9BACL
MNGAINTIIPIDLGGVNSYLITVENGYVLVDTGGHLIMDKTFDNRRKRLVEALAATGCVKGDLRLILLTHGDNDHVANAAYIRNTFDAPIALHPGDLALVENPTLDALMASFQYHSVLLKLVFQLMKKKIARITQKTLEDFDTFKPDLLLSDGMNLKDYGLEGTIIHLPGHTAGSVGLLLPNGSLLAGDTFVNNTKPASAPNALNFSSLYSSIDSLRNKAVKTIYPGHGHPFEFKDFA